MSKKSKHRRVLSLPLDTLKSRTEKAVREGRFQQALELAKQLFKQDPTTCNRDLLHKAYLGRVRQLRQQGHTNDARIVLESALQWTDNNPTYLRGLVIELTVSGGIGLALRLLARITDPEIHSQVLAQAADWALQQGAARRGQLPEPLQGQLDLIVRAFNQLETGQDERVRETLQGIGLQSPFLEWKVLLRGLQAYYQGDDLRAVENWQRLSPERLPARLAGPLRFRIDAAFRQTQPPNGQALLQKQGDSLQGSGLVPPLRALQSVLADVDQLPQAFRLADNLLPALRQQAPELLPRLAACFFWSVVNHGAPEDVAHYERVFGAPTDDLQLNRLRALLFEHAFEMPKAHQAWQRLEESIGTNPQAWPMEIANRARALIWCRMGLNAANVPDPDQFPDLPPFLRDHPARPKPLVPAAEQCFERSLELAPDQLEAHEALFHYYQEQENPAQAEKAARRLLEFFPDHAPTLEALADLRGQQGDYAESLSLLERALKVNPLNRQLRSKVSTAHLFHARGHAEAGRFEEARAEYQIALADQGDRPSVLCKWSACEFKAGAPARAEDLLQQALAQEGDRLAIAYSMLIETVRLKLPQSLKKRFDKDFNAALAEPPGAQAATAIVDTAATHQAAGVTYQGQKTHEKKVLAYLEKVPLAQFTEEQLEKSCRALLLLKALKVLRQYTAQGRRSFPRNPYFYFLEAESYMAQGPHGCPPWKVQPLLMKAQELAGQMPPDEQQKALLEIVEHRLQTLGFGNLFNSPEAMGMLEDVLDALYGAEEGYDHNEFDD